MGISGIKWKFTTVTFDNDYSFEGKTVFIRARRMECVNPSDSPGNG